jgi:MFS family permease
VPPAGPGLLQRRFALLLAARTASLFGDAVVLVAFTFAVLDLTGSLVDLGLVLAAGEVATLVLMLFGGVLADRLERRRLMIGADLTRLGTQGLLAALLLTAHAQLWELVVLQVVRGSAVAVFRPASSGFVPQVVPAARLRQANSLLMLGRSASTVLGPALGGLLVVTIGAGWAIGLDAASFAVSAALLTLIGPVAPPARTAAGSVLHDLAGGWRELRARTWVLASIANFALFQFVVLSSWLVLGPVVARRSLGGAQSWGAIVAAFGAGSVIGAALLYRLRVARPVRTAFLVLLVYVVALVALALALPVPVIAACALIAGWSAATADTLWQTAMQTNLPGEVLSRVSSYDWLGSTLFLPVGLAVVGPVASVAGVEATLLGVSALFVAVTLVLLLGRAIRDPAPAVAAG